MTSRKAGPSARYNQLIAQGTCQEDPVQREALALLEQLHKTVVSQAPASGLLGRLLRRQPRPVKGIYLWGGVGRGKTFLMDLFYETLPEQARLRLHFHRFMQEVHRQLRVHQGEANPLLSVAAHFSRQARVLCFDEFFVTDITDAMLLAGLLDALVKQGVTLVTTSNVMPDDLYKDGLQRGKFLPAIELIKAHTQVHHLDSGTDYRMRALEKAKIYHSPLDDAAEVGLAQAFQRLAPDGGHEGEVLIVEGRLLETRYCTDGVAWFDFPAICDGPRSQNDYIELARLFNTVLVGGVPVFTPAIEDQARRFISLVDEFYDRNVRLILSAAAPIEALYQGERLKFEFQRTESRLQEMQSAAYLAREHRA